MRVRSGGYSGSGVERQGGECWGIDPSGCFFVLSSGLGSEAERASRGVCETVLHALLPHRAQIETMAADARPDARQMLMRSLCGAMIRAEKSIMEYGVPEDGLKLMASCDLVCLVHGTAYIAHVGDCRVYLLRGDTGRQLTIDHTVYERMRAQGRAEEECSAVVYKSRVVRALGMGGGTEIDSLQVDLRQGDRLVMCSSGVHRYIHNATHLAQLYRTMEPQRVSEYLVQYALDRDSATSASVICVEISDPGMRGSLLETDSRITALEQICFFRDLSYQEMLQVMPITFERSFDGGEEIIHEGDDGEELYILVDGRCEVSSGGVRIARLEPGCSFGELSLVDRQPRSATVVALEACRVLVIRATDFERLTLSGALAVKLLWNVAHELSERIRKSSETIRLQGAKLLENGIC